MVLSSLLGFITCFKHLIYTRYELRRNFHNTLYIAFIMLHDLLRYSMIILYRKYLIWNNFASNYLLIYNVKHECMSWRVRNIINLFINLTGNSEREQISGRLDAGIRRISVLEDTTYRALLKLGIKINYMNCHALV